MTDQDGLKRALLRSAISRRQFGRGAVSAAMFAAISAQVARSRPAEAATEELTGPLNVLAWEGYDDPDIMKGFTEKYGVELNVKTASSNANQLDQIRAGAIQFDVVNPDTVWIEKFAKSGLVEPLVRADFPNLEDMFEPFKNCKECLIDDQLYGVITRWGMNGIVHWRDKLSEADAADGNVLWDPKFANRISIIDWHELYIWMTGLWMGMENPGAATGAELDSIIDRLIAVKPNLRAVHGETGACRTDLASQDAWIVWGCSSEQAAIAMRVEGFDIALTIPKQGGAMWTESLQIVKGTQHLATAKAYLNYMTSPETLVKFAWGRQKIMVTNAKVVDLLTPEQVKILNLDRVEEWASLLRLNQAPTDEEGWKRGWERFKAA